MSQIRLHTQRLFDGHNFSDDQVLTIDDGKIIAIDQNTTNIDYYIKGLLAPGFIDLQVNGGGGALFNDYPSADKVKTIMAAHAQFGTTGMMPTLITDKIEVMAKAADAIAQTLKDGVLGILGIHFEGPHLSFAKKGAHSAEFIRLITDEEWQILERKDIGKVIVTLAPETVSTADIKRMVCLGIKVCLGHTNADYTTAQQAVDAGATGFTHLFNAMSPWQGREPGVVGTALLNDQTSCGLIVDGHHVDLVTCQLAIKIKPKGRVFLVTDAMPPVGTNETEFAFFDRTVHLANGKLISTTGELAGSILDMATAVRNCHQRLNITLDEAIRMASQYPTNYLNGEINGGPISLNVGAVADFVVLNDNIEVQETWISGQRVFKK
jgi:N-acetylglucosamine-6-phosphate deacetylase|tara:strand:- start:444 stop:1583 length:1140 start_codon:yes stop_codon:yes gene_type:complete